MVKTQRQQLVRCPTCQGLGQSVRWAGQQWSWRSRIDDGSILERRMERMVRLLLNSFLFLFALAGVALGARDVLVAIDSETVVDVLLSRDWSMGAFWFGILAACYLGYRWYREATRYPRIPSVVEGEVVPKNGVYQPADVLSVISPDVYTVIERAWQHAAQDGDTWVQPGHILQAMAQIPDVASMLIRMGVTPQDLHERLKAILAAEKRAGAIPVPNSATQKVFLSAFQRAARDGHARILLAHVLDGFAGLEDQSRELLFDLHVDDAMLDEAVAWLNIQYDLRHRIRRYQSRASFKPKGAIDRGYTAAATPVLNRFSMDLTALARDGHLPYIVGRDQEMAALFRIIETNRRSVLIVGDSGVGKTSILQALAERMASEDVPEMLQDKRLVALSAAAIVAGAGGAGQLEERLQTVLVELSHAGNIVLAIENFDQLVGASTAGSEGLDAAQIIADAAGRRSVIVVATTTSSAYRRYLERGVIPSSFEKLDLNELDAAQAVRVLQSRVGPLEHTYGVYFTFQALDRAVSLARRFMHQKTLPGSALDLLEEAAVLAKKSGRHALVTGEHVAQLVSEQTNVAVTDMTASEQGKLLHLESLMHERVVGQVEAVNAVADALRRARTELRDPKRPIANLLFLGPTGVGKTELAKTVAEVFFGSESSMIRLDMSEYQDVASISRLLGSSGSERGGYFTDAVREHPYTLVLLDELEKAHPDILNVFLQVMDDGRMTDAAGRTIDFTNVILIATSNAGTQHIQTQLRAGVDLAHIKTEMVQDVLQQYFRPEFLNRFDGIILFTPLNQDEVEKIVTMMVAQIGTRMKEKGITLQATPEAIHELAQIGFDPLFGARPLRRAVQDHVDNALAKQLLEGKIGRRDVAVLEAGGVIRVEKASNLGA